MGGDDAPPPNPFDGALTEVVAQFDLLLEPVMEAAVGHKAKAVSRGFGDAAADQIAAEYYVSLMRILTRKAFSS